MGKARRKREAERAALFREIEQWAFPPSEWEFQQVAEISRLPVVTVHRLPLDHLEWMGMIAGECHANSRFMEQNDPSGKTKRVLGWWLLEGHFTLHSVVRIADRFICVTPAPLHRGSPFRFIPDRLIEERREGNYATLYRSGRAIGPGLRSDPEDTIRQCLETRRRLESGVDPLEAIGVR